MICVIFIIIFASLNAREISSQGYPDSYTTSTQSSNELCKSPIAVTAPNPMNFDPDLLQGTWYIYRHLLTSINGYNRIFRVTTISKTAMPGQTTAPAATQRTSIVWYPTENSTACRNKDFLGFTAYNGLQIVDEYQDDQSLTTRTYFTPLLDTVQGIWVLYRCAEPNLTEYKCDNPHLNVRVRQRPDEMSEGKKKEIDALLDGLLKPYCLSAQQIPLCDYTKAKAECPEVYATPEQQRKIEGLRQTKA